MLDLILHSQAAQYQIKQLFSLLPLKPGGGMVATRV
jgi:hypothetical protein